VGPPPFAPTTVYDELIQKAKSAMAGYFFAKEPDLHDYASWLFLFAWEKQEKYQATQRSSELNSDEFHIAVDIALPSLVSSICDSLIRQRRAYDIRSLGIAVACRHHQDVENAKIAYEKILQNQHPYHIMRCSLCGRSKPLIGSFYFCRTCPDYLLHPECFSRYEQEHLTVQIDPESPGGCNGHGYQEVRRDSWEDDSGYEDVITDSGGQISLVDWLTQMKTRYGYTQVPSSSLELVTFLADILVDTAPY
jgi:hypothetical protein